MEPWKPDYVPDIFPYSNVQIIETWRWRTHFRFKLGTHLSRKTYVFDDLSGQTYPVCNDIHFLTKDQKLDWKIIRILVKRQIRHGIMWEGHEKQWHHIIIHSHRMLHKVIRVLRNHGIQATLTSPNCYFVRNQDSHQ